MAAATSCALFPTSVISFLNILPTYIGTAHIPRFCTQYISEYAVPRFFSGMIFGTDGHMADGTREYPIPSKGTALNYEVVGDAIRTVRANAPLRRSWKARIDEDYKNRSGN